MSIRRALRERVKDGELFAHRTSLPVRGRRRGLYLSEAVQTSLHGPWPSGEHEEQWGTIRQRLDWFVSYGYIGVAQETYRSKDAFLGHLVDGAEEVWELRCRDNKPGVRVFGRFAYLDTFVALTWDYRINLKNKDSFEWIWAKEACKEAWYAIFPNHSPLSGDSVHDYLSGEFFLV
jgi:hypothetical protein